MGCDYKIQIYLEIVHKGGIAYYPFSPVRAYFIDFDIGFYDSDDEVEDRYYNTEEYKKLYKGVREFELKPRKDVVIYCDGQYKKEGFQEKYLPVLINKINKTYEYRYCVESDSGSPLEDISDLIKVTRKEIRYEVGEGQEFYEI
jgi:hypothetical protein